MLWIKSFHIIFMVTWFAGLFYLPRLFVYHANSDDTQSNARFKIMESKLFWGIMTPGAALTIFFGVWLMFIQPVYLEQYWMLWKLALVTLTIIYHIICGKLLYDFKYDKNTHSHVWYRWFNEAPVVFLVAIIFLVEIKPV
ncbi:MAG: CopD family protein [Gammaproteobacteria bacterium]|nr:CopD family protein [Gammaproteobacteria bacterium]